MKSLGQLIAGCSQHHFEPSFSIVGTGDSSSGTSIVKFKNRIKEMENLGHFEALPIQFETTKKLPVTINLHLQLTSSAAPGNSALPISGFPRSLMHAERHLQRKTPYPRVFQY
ncbi:hypothetical protein LX32DRAFT_385880 [Colletotrichum zoysiae]|uniref:Uncharacterized protein n=1 Tax=Colletotrichum zoysiae TaxID=1216348 RepID=A0AAD9M523_9PEZI|nr:hypothetical protein LX32DRAFT_385880 [Colletotrichum zoysiae]